MREGRARRFGGFAGVGAGAAIACASIERVVLETCERKGPAVKLLLHACCGPCSLEPTRLLAAAGHDITIYYANSNIAPREEYARRLDTLEAWARDAGFPVIEGPYVPSTWEDTAGRIGDAAIAQVKAASEQPARACVLAVDPARRRARCRVCYRLRLEETARVARERGFEGIGTTLSVSPYQYTDIIEEEVRRAARAEGIADVFQDFRPYYDEATRKSRELGMYRQNFCGCRISELEAAAERAERKAQRAQEKAAYQAAHADEIAAAQAARRAHRAERAAYDKKQARKRAILKALREQEKRGEA